MFNRTALIEGFDAIIAGREKTRDEAQKAMEKKRSEAISEHTKLRQKAAKFYSYVGQKMAQGAEFTEAQLEGQELFPGHPCPSIVPDQRTYRSDLHQRVSKNAIEGRVAKIEQDFKREHPDNGKDEVSTAKLVLEAMGDDKKTVSQSALDKLGIGGRLVREALVARREAQTR